MHISNLVSQYQRNTNSNSTEELKGATSMQKLVSAVSELTQGPARRRDRSGGAVF